METQLILYVLEDKPDHLGWMVLTISTSDFWIPLIFIYFLVHEGKGH